MQCPDCGHDVQDCPCWEDCLEAMEGREANEREAITEQLVEFAMYARAVGNDLIAEGGWGWGATGITLVEKANEVLHTLEHGGEA